MAKLSKSDKQNLNQAQQAAVLQAKKDWEAANAAGDQAAMDRAHAAAEAARSQAGYSGGASGTGYQVLASGQGGMTADQMRAWAEDYNRANYGGVNTGWTNGYSAAMNTRSKANKIRQQMEANSQAWHRADQATKDYLHQQNLALAEVLYDYTGQSKKNTYYNDQTGRWETWNSDVGYGYNVQHTQPNIANAWKQYYGYTDDQMENWAKDTSLYRNFVDPRVSARNLRDESSGYTGQYAQFVNGPYGQLLGRGTNNVPMEVYTDLYGDGFFDDEQMITQVVPVYDEFGNLVNQKLAPRLKNNNSMTDYTNQFTSYVSNGVIQPGVLAARAGGSSGAYTRSPGYGVDGSDPRYDGGINRDLAASTPEDPNNAAGQAAYYHNYGKNTGLRIGLSGGLKGGNTYEAYINQMYDAAMKAQLEDLKAAYAKNVSALDAESRSVDGIYEEQKRQTAGEAQRKAANWREIANAQGLNSGAVGQAVLAENNQLQQELGQLASAQASAQTEIQRRRSVLMEDYLGQINQAVAEQNYERATALYQEAIRAEEALWERQQLNADLQLQYTKALLSLMK